MLDKLKNATNETIDTASLLTKAELERFKLKMAKAMTKWVTRLVIGFVLMLMLVLFLIFIGMSGAMWLQTYMSASASFAVVGGVFALFALIFFLLRAQLVGNTVLQSILKEMFHDS